MTTPITARALLQEWLDTGNLEGQYVPMAECNKWRELALTNLPVLQAAHMQHKEDTTTVSQLKAILQRWAIIAPLLSQMTTMYQFDTIPGFEQLIADTQAVLPQQPKYIVSGGCHNCGNDVESNDGKNGICVECGAEHWLSLRYDDDDLLYALPKVAR